ncbi:MerR family transcriptional regulator [Streptomyces sp. NPDC058637]|uniref:MerR family transcriptional regulator n=1 Tax=Streptomyces sp. NPDC058637 TaxID=3346569 RepID=UPI00365E170F
MRLPELGGRSGVSTATIKYYLREGQLPAGVRIGATQADYDESPLRRLRLVRALLQAGRLPVATAREVPAHVDDESLGLTIRLGAALWALPHGPAPDEDAPETATARTEVAAMLAELGRPTAEELGELAPAHRSPVGSVATLIRLGHPCDGEYLVEQARVMRRVAMRDLGSVEEFPTEGERVEAAVASAVLSEPLPASRRPAQAKEAAQRYRR